MNNLHYKIAEFSDFNDYYKLKSEPRALFWSGFLNSPDYEIFKDYYEKELGKDERTIIFLYINNKIAGYVSILYCAMDKTVETAHGVLDIFSGRGLGKDLIKYAVNYSKLEIPDADNIIGWIAETNVGSIRNVLANGYTLTEDVDFRTFKQLQDKVRFNKYIKSLK